MALEQKIAKEANMARKLDYYRALGYSEVTASVLAAFTYGDSCFVKFVKDLGEENVLQKIYERVGDDDMGDFMRKIYKKYTEYSQMVGRPFLAKRAKFRSETVNGLTFGAADDGAVVDASISVVGDLAELKQMAENLSSDSYAQIEEKDAKGTFTAPTSTFRMTTTTASMGVVMNQIRNGRRIEMDQVRIEEVLNYFDYDVKAPEKDVFAITTEVLEKSNEKKLLYINAQAKHEMKEHQNIILLLDVSGSMGDNAEVTQMAIATIVSKLKPGDIFSLVTYSSKDETVLKNYAIRNESDKDYLMGKLLSIEINGCTYGSAGIETAYEIGKKNYDEAWNNQVILITDGDLNFGITDKGGLEDLIEEKKKENLFLSVIGTGLWNYQDEKLEVLAKHGNGTYCVVNDLDDVDESVNRHYESLTNIVAKDVKAQVEFNPKFVKEYRLLGYENRELNHEEFKNDKVISEPYGSGGHGVALYELTMGEADNSDLKYQTAVVGDSDELCTVKIRYKEPLADESHEIEQAVKVGESDHKNAELAYLLYCVSEKLRESDKLDEADEEFLKEALEKKDYAKFSELNGEKLKTFIESSLRKEKE